MKKLKSINSIPLHYIKSVIKIDLTSPSGLTWLPRKDTQFKCNNKNAGSKQISKKGYQKWGVTIAYNGKKLRLTCSRIIFLLYNGYLTKGKEVDHIDNNSLNNNPDNLREATRSQNNQNRKISKNNTSGHKSVIWCKRSKKWKVAIVLNYKYHYFGTYTNKEDAVKASIAARKKLHGEFGRNK